MRRFFAADWKKSKYTEFAGLKLQTSQSSPTDPCLTLVKAVIADKSGFKVEQSRDGRRWPDGMNLLKKMWINWKHMKETGSLGNNLPQNPCLQQTITLELFLTQFLYPLKDALTVFNDQSWLSSIAEYKHPYMETIFPVGRSLFWQDSASCHKVTHDSALVWRAQLYVYCVDTAPMLPGSQHSGASAGWRNKSDRWIHGGHTFHFP